ncbi:hypothetical protein PybrP1_000357 [[Pythium] brassicae (nom. inval.)]|nr:hypothetical protein PybrP1_000357 [[Pythium] brassicae (nom. inval.)]
MLHTDSTAEDGAAPKKKKKAPYKDLERRREQNRVNAQRAYYRKLNTLDTLRTEVAVLEASFEAKMQAIKSEPFACFPGEETLLRYKNVAPSTAMSHHHHLQRLAAAHDALKDEQRMLKERYDLHVKFQCRVQLLVDSERPLSVEDLFGTQSEARRAKVLAELRVRCPARMQHPLSAVECHTIGLGVYDKIRTFTESGEFARTGGIVCGWEDRRCVEDGLLKLSLRKVFPNLTAYELAARTWPVLASPERLRSLYSARRKMHCEVAQHVDANNVVLYQEYEAKERDPITGRETDMLVLVRSLVLVTLLQINGGFVVLFYGIDPNRLEDRDEAAALASVGVSDRKVWLNKLSWCIFQDAGDADEDIGPAFASTVSAEGMNRSYWPPIELLVLSMRWEHEVIGPVFTLGSKNDPELMTSEPACAVLPQRLSVQFGSWTPFPTAPHDPSVFGFRDGTKWSEPCF